MANDLTFDAIIEINDRSFIPRFTSGENPGGLSNSYEDLKLLPLINDITIMGNHNGAYYKLQDKMRALTAEEIENIVDGGEIIPSPDERYVTEYMLAYYNTFVASRTDLENKVDKIPGWGLSQANFTQEEKTKLANMNAGGEVNRINAISVNGVIRPPSPAPSKTVALTIPTRTAQLQNDANFQTFNQMVTYTNNKYDILIPAQASATNQLADKDFVNSTFTSLNANRVTSNAAGDGFPTRNALLTAVIFYHGGVPYTPTQHDYALIEADEGAPSPYTGGQTRMEFDGTQWNYAYGINDRPFTAAETAAIESGITAGLVGNISEPDETPRQDSMKYVTSGGLWTEFGGNRQELETENKTIIGAINEALNATSPLSNDPNLNDPNTGLSTVGSKAIMDEVARKTPLRYATVTTLGTSPGANNLFLVGRYVNAVNNERDTITFLVNDTLLNSGADRYGILRIAIENSNVTNRAISIQWLANSGYNPDDFILAYDGATGINELYIRESVIYQSHTFTVISEDILSGTMVSSKGERWVLMRNPAGQASFPSGYNQVASQRANIGMMPLRYSSIASTATEAWGQVGSLSLSGTWRDSTITLHVSEIEYNNVFIGVTRFGTLKVTLGTTGTSVFTPSALWEYVSGFNPDDTVLLYTSSGTNGTFELWQRAGSTGETVRFTVIDESDTTGRPVTLWNINERPTPVSSLPTGYTIVPSTVAQLQPATGGGDGENLLVNTGGAGEEGVINTSGLTEWTAAGITINMWNHERAGQGVVTLNNGILRTERIAATANELLTQTIEASQFTQGATYTLSIRYKSNASVRFSAAIRGGSLYKDLPPSPDGFTFASLSIVAGTTLEDAVVSIYLQTSSAFVGGYFELDTTRPFAKLELGSVSTLENDSPPNYNEEFLRTTGASPTQVNPNLLGNPQGNVNQSGRTEWTTAGYTVDRWLHYREGQGTVSLTNNILRMERNISFSEPEGLSQRVNTGLLIPGKTYTISLRFRGKGPIYIYGIYRNTAGPVFSATLLFSGITDDFIIKTFTFIMPDNISSDIEIIAQLRNVSGGAIGDYIEFDTTRPFAKLEIGSVSTLANDSPVDYATELAKCKRYLRRISGSNTSVYRAVKVEPNSITFSIPLPGMRTTPTIVGTPSFTISTISGESITGFALRIISYDGTYLRMQADKTNHGLTDASIYIADLLLDANL